jgi:hypothetical protein
VGLGIQEEKQTILFDQPIKLLLDERINNEEQNEALDRGNRKAL